MCLGGAGLARGYLGDAALTAQKFVPHPYARHPGERLYCTGDLVRLRADGALDFIGRVDHQVKIRGFRIELGEIEQALRQHAQVNEVLVLARGEGSGERRLVAYIVPHEACGPEWVGELVEHLKGRLPEYALPSAFVLLKSLPLNSNGKVDRQQLPEPEESDYARAEYVAPRTGVEERLVALWQGNLGRAGLIGIEDNYFALGGDSIRSIGLVSAARAQGLQFSIKDLFAHPTIAQLAAVVQQVKSEAGAVPQREPFALLSERERGRYRRSIAVTGDGRLSDVVAATGDVVSLAAGSELGGVSLCDHLCGAGEVGAGAVPAGAGAGDVAAWDVTDAVLL